MKHRAVFLSALFLLGTLGGCRREGAAACDEFVEVYGTRLVECGVYSTQAEAEAAIIADLAEGSPPRIQTCDDFWGLRNRVDFHDECIPGIRIRDCADGTLPPSCVDQLLYE